MNQQHHHKKKERSDSLISLALVHSFTALADLLVERQHCASHFPRQQKSYHLQHTDVAHPHTISLTDGSSACGAWHLVVEKPAKKVFAWVVYYIHAHLRQSCRLRRQFQRQPLNQSVGWGNSFCPAAKQAQRSQDPNVLMRRWVAKWWRVCRGGEFFSEQRHHTWQRVCCGCPVQCCRTYDANARCLENYPPDSKECACEAWLARESVLCYRKV